MAEIRRKYIYIYIYMCDPVNAHIYAPDFNTVTFSVTITKHKLHTVKFKKLNCYSHYV